MDKPLQILLSCNSYAGDYFSRLGGSGRYQAFMNWHIPALVLLVSVGEIGSDLLPEAMWSDTDQLPAQIKLTLQDAIIPKDALLQFIEASDQRLSKLNNPREVEGWNYFLRSASPYWSPRESGLK